MIKCSTASCQHWNCFLVVGDWYVFMPWIVSKLCTEQSGHFRWKPVLQAVLSLTEICNPLKCFWPRECVSISRGKYLFSKAVLFLPLVTAADSEASCVCVCLSEQQTERKCTAPRVKSLTLHSQPCGTGLEIYFQMISKGSNLDSNLNSAPWTTSSSCHWLTVFNTI